MGLLDFFVHNRTSVDANYMMGYARRFASLYMRKYAIGLSVDVENEALIFSSWAVWDYCLNTHIMKDPHEQSQTYICAVAVETGMDSLMGIVSFYQLYAQRFKLYKKDITGLTQSHYPQTKQYIPLDLYMVIYQHQYQIYSATQEDYNIYGGDAIEFASEFIGFWNEICQIMEKEIR